MRQLCLLLLASAAVSHAGIISTAGQNNGVTVDVTDITGFQTTGSMMAGLSITGTFAGGATAACAWATTGATSGGCSAFSGDAAFSISLDGDTFTSTWRLGILGSLNLVSLYFNGIPGSTVFDRGFGGAVGTEGTSTGNDATGITQPIGVNGSATYIDQVATLGSLPINDIFARVQIDFSNGGLTPSNGSTAAAWTMDTDNIGIRGGPRDTELPEPATWTMLLSAGALIALGLRRAHQ